MIQSVCDRSIAHAHMATVRCTVRRARVVFEQHMIDPPGKKGFGHRFICPSGTVSQYWRYTYTCIRTHQPGAPA